VRVFVYLVISVALNGLNEDEEVMKYLPSIEHSPIQILAMSVSVDLSISPDVRLAIYVCKLFLN
jgi:hypothetical protein